MHPSADSWGRWRSSAPSGAGSRGQSRRRAWVVESAVTATVLSHLGKHGPLLVVEPDQVPEDARRFLEERRTSYVTPNEALYNHGWIIGTDISNDVQAQLDDLLAIERQLP